MKASAREILDTTCFQSIDVSFFALYQVELNLQRPYDYNNNPGISDDLLKSAKLSIRKSIEYLAKYASMEQATIFFNDWVKSNDETYIK
ncbi:MAG: hypothetical protein P4L59_17985 [Desulfosporosinus sp.]|nr:hypothetical protein [Desulfosporosinus sp.]